MCMHLGTANSQLKEVHNEFKTKKVNPSHFEFIMRSCSGHVSHRLQPSTSWYYKEAHPAKHSHAYVHHANEVHAATLSHSYVATIA